jgi:hypothetical protein
MSGEDRRSDGLFSYVLLEKRIPADHPLRAIRMSDAAPTALSRNFDKLFAQSG